FFFQAEDGIRDATVTGVQTCALPIYPKQVREMRSRTMAAAAGQNALEPGAIPQTSPPRTASQALSELYRNPDARTWPGAKSLAKIGRASCREKSVGMVRVSMVGEKGQ